MKRCIVESFDNKKRPGRETTLYTGCKCAKQPIFDQCEKCGNRITFLLPIQIRLPNQSYDEDWEWANVCGECWPPMNRFRRNGVPGKKTQNGQCQNCQMNDCLLWTFTKNPIDNPDEKEDLCFSCVYESYFNGERCDPNEHNFDYCDKIHEGDEIKICGVEEEQCVLCRNSE